MLTWHIAQVTQGGRKAMIALRERRWTVYCPMERVWRSVPKGPREAVERPVFPGYLFVGQAPWNDYDELYAIDGLTRTIEHGLTQERLRSTLFETALRQCAGEFDDTRIQPYLPPKPIVGKMTYTVGHGLDALAKLKTTTPEGRMDLLLTGQLDGDGLPSETYDQAA